MDAHMTHNLTYGTVNRPPDKGIAKEISDLLSEIEQGAHPRDILLKTIHAKANMLDALVLDDPADDRLLHDILLVIKQTVETTLLKLLDEEDHQVSYLRLLVTTLQNIFKGDVNMCQQVEDCVNSLVTDRKAFTAWNVTMELRSQGKKAFHTESRSTLRSMARRQALNDYLETQIQPSGFPSPAILYYPPEMDPNDFTGDIMTAKVQLDDDEKDEEEDEEEDEDDGTKVGVVPGTKKVIRKLTADGILYVPRWMGREIDAEPGDVHIERSDTAVELLVITGAPDDDGGRVHVDPRTNIRIGKATLHRLGADWDAYEIEKVGDEIVIRQA